MRLLALLFLAMTAVAPASAAPQPTPIVSVPYRLDYTGWFTIPVAVNGQGPYDFIIDTGATKTLVFQNLAGQQTFPPSDGPPQFVLGLGSTGTYPTFIIGEVAVGPAKLPALNSVILPDWEGGASPAGVLGLDFLSQYIVVFEADSKRVIFYPVGSSPKEIRHWGVVRLKKNDFGLGAGDLYTLDAKLDYRKVPFLVDLGASGTIINRAAYGSVTSGRFTITTGPSGRSARITDAMKKTKDADLVRIDRFELARKVIFYHRILAVHDAKIFQELGQAGRPFGLLGDDMLRERSFAFDIARGELRIGPQAKD
ncbi:MAG: hypothetical protein GC153_03860 [Alphaproteobacteria bacterium]|nr:hypothetical protein [Alphaproteobacteria bacterium]